MCRCPAPISEVYDWEVSGAVEGAYEVEPSTVVMPPRSRRPEVHGRSPSVVPGKSLKRLETQERDHFRVISFRREGKWSMTLSRDIG